MLLIVGVANCSIHGGGAAAPTLETGPCRKVPTLWPTCRTCHVASVFICLFDQTSHQPSLLEPSLKSSPHAKHKTPCSLWHRSLRHVEMSYRRLGFSLDKIATVLITFKLCFANFFKRWSQYKQNRQFKTPSSYNLFKQSVLKLKKGRREVIPVGKPLGRTLSICNRSLLEVKGGQTCSENGPPCL